MNKDELKRNLDKLKNIEEVFELFEKIISTVLKHTHKNDDFSPQDLIELEDEDANRHELK